MSVPPLQVDPDDPASLDFWLEHFGVTRQQLAEAVLAVGRDPEAVHEHLLNQGSSAGVG
jgi:hypothetical protein